MTKWLARIGIGLALLVGVVAILLTAFFLSFELSVPDYDGKAQVAGLNAPARIVRDQYAIPHIAAASFQDAVFALGYAHAQDRLWQMEVSRRAIAGRLSELFGASTLPIDTMMRSIGLYRAAEAALAHLSPEARAILNSYADGVNAYIAGHTGRWPVEFTLAGDTPPEPWRPADSLAVLKGMAFQLSTNMWLELARAKLLPKLGRQRVQEFFPPFEAAPLPEWYETLFNPTQVGEAIAVPDHTASDNWVVDGRHTVTGKPMVANDPHLGYAIPSVWYLAHLAFAGEEVVGGTLPGIPGIIAGRTRHLAWGLTNVGPDTQDLYLERINPQEPHEYQTPQGWARFGSRVETIAVRFGGDVHIEVRSTRHGPVMQDSGPFEGVAPKGCALALAWTALMPDDTTIEVTFGLDRAQSAAQLNGLAARFVTPMQNMVYADDSGNIGLVLPGRVPIRRADNDSQGLVPSPGWQPQYDWQGFVPLTAEPKVENPPIGYIATANNDTLPKGYPYTFSYEWETNYRYDRIMALLGATPRHSLASMAAIQTDIVDGYALALMQILKGARPMKGRAAEAERMLENWDGAMRRGRPEPLIFAAWARALSKRIYADELGDAFENNWGYEAQFTVRVLTDANVPGQSRWCDDRNTDAIETCPEQIRAALDDALAELTAAYGDNMAAWRWGDAHHALHGSQPLGGLPLIGGFFNRDVEVDGGPNTLLRQANFMANAHPYAALHGAGYRAVYDLAEPERSLFIISTGESGNAFSPHYDDLLPLWAAGRYITIPARPAAVMGTTELRPAP